MAKIEQLDPWEFVSYEEDEEGRTVETRRLTEPTGSLLRVIVSRPKGGLSVALTFVPNARYNNLLCRMRFRAYFCGSFLRCQASVKSPGGDDAAARHRVQDGTTIYFSSDLEPAPYNRRSRRQDKIWSEPLGQSRGFVLSFVVSVC